MTRQIEGIMTQEHEGAQESANADDRQNIEYGRGTGRLEKGPVVCYPSVYVEVKDAA